ncbi:DUF5615 family PIN-like protein [Sphingomonas floccifaciens]|uniref:DUF5615 family PIN-like protein n=1 Tax=Sphingomonas floccifaciens TaxID=1844115 RepID=A0ABW4NC16_9SPHN
MRLFADENVHRKVVFALRATGRTVEWIRESSAGTEDPDILARPDIGDLVLITNDGDFGNLIFQELRRAPRAILYTRTLHRDWQGTTDLILAELERGIVADHMTIITKDGTRRRPFPTGEDNG